MRDEHLALLRCPHCHEPLGRTGAPDGPQQVGCGTGHRFDVARQGHLTLLPPHRDRTTGDTAAMVDARARFLAGPAYAPLREAVAAATAAACAGAPGAVVDVGCGPGTYLVGACTAARRPGLGLDLSPAAARRTARADRRVGAVVADTHAPWPVRDGVAAVVLDVFAPRHGVEMRRVLHPDGRLVVVTPREDHLHELVDRADLIGVDSRKAERLAQQLGPWFVPEERTALRWETALTSAEVADLVHMGPSHHHRERTAPPTTDVRAVTASVDVVVHRPRETSAAG